MAVFIFLAVFFSVVIALMAKVSKKGRKKAPPPLATLTNLVKRPVMSAYEQKLFTVLTEALPGCVILAQVAFSALIDTKNKASRNRFDRKVADFVVCSKQMTVIAIIELDDSSHKSKALQDADRDAMLKNAGYDTIRYTGIPAIDTLRRDIASLILKQKVAVASRFPANVADQEV